MAPKNNSPFPPGSLICAYLRDSGGDDQDLSVPQQEASLRAWCFDNGLTLSLIFSDVAAPGSSIVGRAAFLRMIQHFRAKGCTESGLIIWKFSRFARSIDDSMFYKADLRRMGFIVHSINDDIPQGIDGRFFEAARDWMNEKFLQDLSEDVKRGLSHLVQTYGAVPGVPPTGFQRVPMEIGKRRDGSPHIVHRWQPDPDLLHRTRLAWQMRARHASLSQIHAATALCGTINSYTTLFRNPLYKGELRYADLIIPNYCEAIVDELTWQSVQDLIQVRNTTHPRRVNSRYLLSGLVFCARCGSPMNGHTIPNKVHSYDYYRCGRLHNRRDCDAPPIPRLLLEDLVLAQLTEDVLNPTTIAAHQAEIDRNLEAEANLITAERIDLNKRLSQVNRRLGNVIETIAEYGKTPALIDKMASMDSEKHELQNALAELAIVRNPNPLTADQIHVQADQLRALTAARPDHEDDLRTIIHGMIHKITVERENRASLRGLLVYYHPPEVLVPGEFMSMSVCPHGTLVYKHKFTLSIVK